MSEQLTTVSIGLTPPPRQIDEPDPEFEAFYQRYPRKVAKPAARRAWKTARRRYPNDDILQALEVYPFSVDPKFRPHPSTWLNQERWRDVPVNLAKDAYGLMEFLDTLPTDGTLSARAYDVEELRAVLVATGWPPTWRGPLDVLDAWMRDGYDPTSVSQVIAAAVTEFGGRASLSAFDKRVRFRAAQIIAS